MTWAALSELGWTLLPASTGVAGYLLGGAAAAYRVDKRQAAHRDLSAQLRRPVDLYPSDVSGFWEARR
jgi:hypothetical protein